MFKRLFWLSVGVGLGVTVAIQLSRWTRRQRERMSPANLAQRAGEGVADLGAMVSGFIEEFRKASAEREAELRATLEE